MSEGDEEVLQSDAVKIFELAERLGIEELLPEWEITVFDDANSDTWDHWHPRAANGESAVEKAIKMAPYDEPRAELVFGPYSFESMTGSEIVDDLLELAAEDAVLREVSGDGM